MSKEIWRSVDDPPSTTREVLCRSVPNEHGRCDYWIDRCAPQSYEATIRSWDRRRPHVWRDLEPRDNAPEFSESCVSCFATLTLAPKADPYEVDRAIKTEDHEEIERLLNDYARDHICEKCAAALVSAIEKRREKAAEP